MVIHQIWMKLLRLENRLYKTYDKIDEAEELLISAKTKKRALLADKITGDNIYKALILL